MPQDILSNTSVVKPERLFLGMSQEKLGDAIGLTFQQVQKYEKGTNRIDSSRLVQIATALQKDPAWFFAGIVETATGQAAAAADPVLELGQTAVGQALAIAFAAIKDPARRRLLVLLAGELAAND
jgi:transcriptional regulator with XRE-family HTH domain